MEIKSSLINRSGQKLNVVYYDIDSAADISDKKVRVVHGLCFCGDKLVIVKNGEKGYWTPPGGAVEPGETAEQATIREIKEESNMRVIKHRFIGCQDIYEPTHISTQTRSVCIVEPYGPFVSDPDGDITEIKLIDPADLDEYLNWGEVGEHILNRALAIRKELQNKKQ